MKALLTLDGSKISESILPTAKRLTELIPDLELHLLTVLDPKSARGTLAGASGTSALGSAAVPATGRTASPRMVESHGEAQERMHRDSDAVMTVLAHEWFTEVQPVLHVEWSSEPARAIVSYANTIDADVIVMATHGRTGLSHLLVGSVTEAVIRHSGRPVLVRCASNQA